MTRFEALAVGQSAELVRTIGDREIALFTELTGDRNPVHFDDDYARQAGFGGRIAHGMIAGSLISVLLGMHVPGPGSVYLGQSFRFLAPVRIGDTVTVRVEIVALRPEKRHVRLATTAVTQRGVCVLDGEALIKVMDTAIPPAPSP